MNKAKAHLLSINFKFLLEILLEILKIKKNKLLLKN